MEEVTNYKRGVEVEEEGVVLASDTLSNVHLHQRRSEASWQP